MIDRRSCSSGGARPSSMAFQPGPQWHVELFNPIMVAIGRQAGFSSCWCRIVASVVTEAILANTLDSIPSCSLLHGKSSQCHGENGKGADSSFSLPSIAPLFVMADPPMMCLSLQCQD